MTSPLPAAAESMLVQGIDRLGLEVFESDRQRLLALLALLRHWNRRFNLTAVRDPLRMVPYHLLDSLAVSPYLRGTEVLDVGTGAGFPGLPLAIIHPEIRFVLLDSNGKKVRFVRQAIMELNISNVEAVQARVESLERASGFSTIVTRAFAALPEIVQLTSHLLVPRGVLLALKSRQAETELEALLHSPIQARLRRLQVPFLEGQRSLIEIEP